MRKVNLISGLTKKKKKIKAARIVCLIEIYIRKIKILSLNFKKLFELLFASKNCSGVSENA